MRSTSGSPTVRIWSRNASSYFTSAPYDRVGVTATARGRQPRRSAGLLDLLEVELAELAVARPLERFSLNPWWVRRPPPRRRARGRAGPCDQANRRAALP